MASSASKRMAMALTLVAVISSCGQRKDASPIAVDLCTLVTRPEQFDGELVAVPASVLADGHHGAAIVDPKCPEKGAALWRGDESREQPSVHQLDEAIFRTGMAGTIHKDITGTFIGTFRWDPVRWWERNRVWKDRPLRRLELLDIKHFRVTGKPPSASRLVGPAA